MLLSALIVAFVALAALYALDRQSRQFKQERSELLTRIQAPELAPTLSAPEPSDEALYVPYDDDEAYADYIEKRRSGELV